MFLNVNLNENSYDIIIERNALTKFNQYVNLTGKVLILTDDGIPSTYVKTLLKQFTNCYVYVIKSGETSKNFTNFEKILSFLIEKNFTRTDALVALGGGVVGDLGGFVASCYMRGIDFYNIPSTLLAQVDSSIGGKTAINHMGVKNIIGSFYQPKKVIIDVELLKTLDERIFNSGLVEVIKMAATMNKELFNLIATTDDIARDIEIIVTEALKLKKRVVEEDPKEKNLRKVLNFGHTIGHAIESLAKGKLYHGECVGLGMLYVSSKTVKTQILEVLKKYHLPTATIYKVDDLIKYIEHDKKMSGKKLSIIYVEEIGEFCIKTILTSQINELFVEV